MINAIYMLQQSIENEFKQVNEKIDALFLYKKMNDLDHESYNARISKLETLNG